MAENPYAAPAAKVADVVPEGEVKLADRGDRLLAAIVDGVVAIPMYIALVFMIVQKQNLNVAAVILMIVYASALLVVNLVLLHKNGQTIGKKLLKIKIVRKDGSRATLGRIFWLRMVLNGIIAWIPYLRIYGLIDILFIFGEPRRCIHDYIADTIVVSA